MRIKEVRSGKTLTLWLRKYESVKIEVGLTAEVEPGEDPQMIRDELSRQVDDQIIKDAGPYLGMIEEKS